MRKYQFSILSFLALTEASACQDDMSPSIELESLGASGTLAIRDSDAPLMAVNDVEVLLQDGPLFSEIIEDGGLILRKRELTEINCSLTTTGVVGSTQREVLSGQRDFCGVSLESLGLEDSQRCTVRFLGVSGKIEWGRDLVEIQFDGTASLAHNAEDMGCEENFKQLSDTKISLKLTGPISRKDEL